jgi:TorA maturation chaperone TorD
LSAVSKITDLQYRHRAQEARKLADELTDPDAKCKMLKIAEDYEKLSIQAVQAAPPFVSDDHELAALTEGR